jgi:Arc/MetJ-type ribon-helix-helix transcriptional regulator
MKQILIEIDADTAARLDKVAPARSRRRSEFIRNAIRRALWDMEERATERAYAAQPDSADDTYLDPAVWDRGQTPRPRARPR